MITVTALSPYMETSRKFKSDWGIKTYLKKLKRLHKSHLVNAKQKINLKITINHIN
jgi:hypothetical protein